MYSDEIGRWRRSVTDSEISRYINELINFAMNRYYGTNEIVSSTGENAENLLGTGSNVAHRSSTAEIPIDLCDSSSTGSSKTTVDAHLMLNRSRVNYFRTLAIPLASVISRFRLSLKMSKSTYRRGRFESSLLI